MMYKVLDKTELRKGRKCPICITSVVGTTHNEVMPSNIKIAQHFESISEASRLTGIDRSHIVGNLRGRYPHARGYCFAYIEEVE